MRLIVSLILEKRLEGLQTRPWIIKSTKNLDGSQRAKKKRNYLIKTNIHFLNWAISNRRFKQKKSYHKSLRSHRLSKRLRFKRLQQTIWCGALQNWVVYLSQVLLTKNPITINKLWRLDFQILAISNHLLKDQNVIL